MKRRRTRLIFSFLVFSSAGAAGGADVLPGCDGTAVAGFFFSGGGIFCESSVMVSPGRRPIFEEKQSPLMRMRGRVVSLSFLRRISRFAERVKAGLLHIKCNAGGAERFESERVAAKSSAAQARRKTRAGYWRMMSALALGTEIFSRRGPSRYKTISRSWLRTRRRWRSLPFSVCGSRAVTVMVPGVISCGIKTEKVCGPFRDQS